MYREEPDFDINSGWRFLSGDESQSYVDDTINTSIYEVNTITNYDNAIISYPDLPVGTNLERIKGTDIFDIVD